ncbi:MAG: beta strand repeat-containing protein, partial [Bacteroidales bacterium]
MDTRINHVATIGKYKIYPSEKGSLLQRSFFLLVLLMAISVNSFGQTAGDYRTRATGNWNANTTWQKYNGTAWANCTAGDYPGVSSGAGTVTILNNTNVTLNASPAYSIGNLNLQTGNRATYITFSGTNSLTVSGTTTIEVPTSTNTGRYKYIRVLAGSLSTGNVVMDASSDDGRDSYIEISTGSVTVSSDITMSGSNYRNYFVFTGSGVLYVGGNMTGGGITSTVGDATTAPTTGTVNYNSASSQSIGSYTYYNLTTSGGGTKSLGGAVTVNYRLTLTSGVLQLGDYNLAITSTVINAILGTYSSTNMIETNGSGYLIRPAATTLPIVFPVGSNGHYSVVTISALSGGTGGDIRIRTEFDNTLGSNYLPRTWEAITSILGKTLTAKFNYDAAETSIVPTKIWVKPSSGAWQAPTGTSSFGTTSFTIVSTTDITSTSTFWTAGLLPDTYFSYQTGSWNNPSTWTSDPGGTTQVGTTVPGDGDVVVILSGRTVTLPADISTASLEVNINSGGTLNMSTYSFTSGLSALYGSGTLKLASTNFPTTLTNVFVNAGGGTVEYNNTSNFILPAAQATYNNLTVNTSVGVVCTQLSDLTLNGNLLVKQGTYRINDNTSTTKLNLTIGGNVTVNSGAYITVGQGATNTTTNPTSLSGGTAPFLNYYEQFHRVIINGNFTNNGTVKFTNLTAPIYNAFPPLGSGATSGAASVYFQGTSNATMLCNGTTDFYNIILDKGTDQTYSLTIQPLAYSNFRIFGANNAATIGTVENPDLMKALWIRNGSLVLSGLTIIPSLTEGTTAGSEYYIPANGALTLSGIDVIVLNTADDAGEADIAYGITGTTGVNTSGAAYQGMVVYGKLQVNDGYLSTRESAGLLYSSVNSGQFEINGGTIDAKQFRTYDGSSSGAEYRQTDGTFILR